MPLPEIKEAKPYDSGTDPYYQALHKAFEEQSGTGAKASVPADDTLLAANEHAGTHSDAYIGYSGKSASVSDTTPGAPLTASSAKIESTFTDIATSIGSDSSKAMFAGSSGIADSAAAGTGVLAGASLLDTANQIEAHASQLATSLTNPAVTGSGAAPVPWYMSRNWSDPGSSLRL